MSTHLILYLVSTVGKVLLNETWLISKFPATSTISLSSSPLTLYFKVVWLLQCLDSKHFITNTIMAGRAFPGGASGKERACQCRSIRDMGLIPGSWRSPGGGHATHSSGFHSPSLENPMDRGAWRARVHRVHTESDMTEVTEHTHNGCKISLLAQCFSNCNVHMNQLNG